MIKALRAMGRVIAVGLLLAVTPTTAHAQNLGYVAHARAPVPDASDALGNAVADVRGLVGTPISVGGLG